MPQKGSAMKAKPLLPPSTCSGTERTLMHITLMNKEIGKNLGFRRNFGPPNYFGGKK
jgi:hypothetical protein